MPLKCIALDDEPLALELLEQYANKLPAIKLVATFEDALAASSYLRSTSVDLIFADIQMPDITGIDFIRSLENKPLIIFTTAYKKFAFEGFELDAVDYLLKPISFERFSKAVQKATEIYQYKHQATSLSPLQGAITVYSEYKMVRIELSDIEYIESYEDYVKIHLLTAKPVMTLMPLKKMLEKLPQEYFQRIHRSFIVSLKQVHSIGNKKITLQSGKELPLSDSFQQGVKDALSK